MCVTSLLNGLLVNGLIWEAGALLSEFQCQLANKHILC